MTAHTDIRDAQIQITSWTGCTMTGTINSVGVTLWADSAMCPTLKAKVPGAFYASYCANCKQVLRLSDAPLPPVPVVTPALRKVAWPTGEAKENAILEVQWKERYRFKRHLSGAYAEFEHV